MKDDVTIFCENLKALRGRAGLSQEEMARRLEVAVEHLDAMERGTLPPEVDVGIFFNLYDGFGIWPGRMFEEWDAQES